MQSRLLGMIVWDAFLRIAKTCEHRSAAKHCVQVQLRRKILVDGFLSRLFLLSRMLNEQKKTFTDQAPKHGRVGGLFNDR